jgi:hypothetical protein
MNARSRLGSTLALVFATGALGGCRDEIDAAAPGASASARAVPVDRLAERELEPGNEAIYGLSLPDGMRVIARFADSMHAAGDLSPEDVTQYVRDRVVVSRVELEAGGTVFPNARIKGSDSAHVYRIEVSGGTDSRRTTLAVEDVTAPKAVQGIDDAERLRRVGLEPNGRLLNPEKLE